jgi:carbon-monoxide dehydrogenase small subunit
MKVSLTVNGAAAGADVEPRTSLADFLREHLLLTGTHVGCEHGVCGACTVLIDGEPARSCIAFAATCEGRAVHTIEGLEDDAVMAALRKAFSAEHALQCGYCTPGMLITARDIVRRLPDADDARVRLELAGNLCRCTGYVGIVRAIRRVLDLRLDVAAPAPEKIRAGTFGAAPTVTQGAVAPRAAPTEAPPGGEQLVQTLRIGLPREAVWQAVCDPALIASCIPGARHTSVDAGRIAGEMAVAVGPVQARFSGSAVVRYDPSTFSGRIDGQGNDAAAGSRLSAAADFRVEADGARASTIALNVTYALRGALAQLGRGPIVKVLAAEIADTVARNLEARLRGEPAPPAEQKLGGGSLMLRAIWRWLKMLFGARSP